MWNDISEAPFLRGSRGAMRSVSAGRGGDEFMGIAVRGGTTFLGTKAALTSLGLSPGYATAAAVALAAAEVTPDCIDWWKRTERSFRKIPQCGLVEGTTEELNTLYDGRICRQSRQPYHFEYSKPGYAFTGIACLPVSTEIQSPEAQVIKGGLNCSSVTIRLTPVEEGEWSCRVLVCGKLCTTGPSAYVSKQTGRAVAASSERSFRTIPQCRLVEGTAEERDALHEKTIFLQSLKPYDYEYSKPGYTFTGISCLPVSAEIPSPDAKVIEGGINCSFVTIRLTPVEEGHSVCRVLVCGRLSSTGPSADVSKQTGRAVASASAVSASALPAVADYVVPQVWVLLLVIGLLFSFMCGWCLRNVT